MSYVISDQHIENYRHYLILEERSEGTVRKYLRDLRTFLGALPGDKAISKETVIAYKERLAKKYAVSTANAMLAAINGLFAFLGWHDCRVKPLKQQRRVFRDQARELTKAEYLRLLDAAGAKENRRLFYLMQTLCATGIRISELCFITVEAARTGRAEVTCKGKTRPVLLPKKLCRALLGYCREKRIAFGPIFVTRTGQPVNRSNVWAEMKRLCESAGVDPQKVFPQNFRHLFAVTFYNLEKDIAKLADLLGHASIETTRIYIMVSGEEHIRQVERLGLVV